MDPQRSFRADVVPAHNPFARFTAWSVLAVWTAATGWDAYQHGVRAAASHALHSLAFLLLAATVLLLIYGCYRLLRPRQ